MKNVLRFIGSMGEFDAEDGRRSCTTRQASCQDSIQVVVSDGLGCIPRNRKN
jgi:hypothetical protein